MRAEVAENSEVYETS